MRPESFTSGDFAAGGIKMLKTPFTALLAAIVAVATPLASRAAILETTVSGVEDAMRDELKK